MNAQNLACRVEQVDGERIGGSVERCLHGRSAGVPEVFDFLCVLAQSLCDVVYRGLERKRMEARCRGIYLQDALGKSAAEERLYKVVEVLDSIFVQEDAEVCRRVVCRDSVLKLVYLVRKEGCKLVEPQLELCGRKTAHAVLSRRIGSVGKSLNALVGYLFGCDVAELFRGTHGFPPTLCICLLWYSGTRDSTKQTASYIRRSRGSTAFRPTSSPFL